MYSWWKETEQQKMSMWSTHAYVMMGELMAVSVYFSIVRYGGGLLFCVLVQLLSKWISGGGSTKTSRLSGCLYVMIISCNGFEHP